MPFFFGEQSVYRSLYVALILICRFLVRIPSLTLVDSFLYRLPPLIKPPPPPLLSALYRLPFYRLHRLPFYRLAPLLSTPSPSIGSLSAPLQSTLSTLPTCIDSLSTSLLSTLSTPLLSTVLLSTLYRLYIDPATPNKRENWDTAMKGEGDYAVFSTLTGESFHRHQTSQRIIVFMYSDE